MADVADEAQALSETSLERSLKNISIKAPSFSGVCLYCEEPVGRRRYCDSYCREQHESSLRRTR